MIVGTTRTILTWALALTLLLLLSACGSDAPAPQQATSPTAQTQTINPSVATAEANFALGPTGIPTTNPSQCPPVPTSQDQSATVHTPCVVELEGSYPSFRMTAAGFKPRERLTTELRGPDGELVERNYFKNAVYANQNGNHLVEDPMGGFPDHVTGHYTRTIEGRQSGHKATGHFYFKSLPEPTPIVVPGLPALAEVKLDTSAGHNTPESALKVTVPFRAEIRLASPGDGAYLSFEVTAEQESLLPDGIISATFTNPYLAQDGAVVVKLDPGYERNSEGSSRFDWKIGEWDQSPYLLKVTATGDTSSAKKPIILEVKASQDF